MKAIYLTAAAACFSMVLSAQCHVYDIPSVDQGSADCYINDVTLDAYQLSVNSGIQPGGNSYQAFPAPLVSVSQGQQFYLSISGTHNGTYTQRVWIDFDNDSIYTSAELVGTITTSTTFTVGHTITVPYDAVADTVHMRILKYDAISTIPDACYNWNAGEAEDYRLVITCSNVNYANYNGSNFLCYADSVMLDAFTPYGDVTWYTDTLLGPQYTGNFFTLHMNGFVQDTTIYIHSTTAGCYDAPLQPVQLTFTPSPIVNIIGPDTVQSCSAVTLDAGAGHNSYNWSNGDQTQTTTITTGYGGLLTVWVDNQFGCFASDEVYVNIAPQSPATYAHIYPNVSFCSTQEVLLIYDSIINPAMVTWLTYPSGTPIGNGAGVLYTLPDTGYFQYQAIINSMCGMDTAIVSIYAEGLPTYDSLYATNASQDSTGMYVLCGGNVDIVIAGFNGNVDHWEVSDITDPNTFTWYDDDSLFVPVQFLEQGHIYTAWALIENAQGCEDSTALIYFTAANTLAFSWPDTSWRCSFPLTYGIAAVNYAVYDILWNTGDTTNTINVAAPGFFTITTIDNSTGCTINEQVYIADGSMPDDALPDTTAVCNGTAYFDPSLNGFNAFYWSEYDTQWNNINNDGNWSYTIFDNGFDEYLVMQGQNAHGCNITDTTYVDFGGTFTFSLGPDVITVQNPYTIVGPSGYTNYMWNPTPWNGQSLQVTMSGTYSLTIDNGQGCTYTDVINITINPMGIQPETDHAVSVYPNPASDIVNVSSPEVISEVNIYDAEGRHVRSEPVQRNNAELFTGDLATGLYQLEIVTTSGKQREKLVIAR